MKFGRCARKTKRQGAILRRIQSRPGPILFGAQITNYNGSYKAAFYLQNVSADSAAFHPERDRQYGHYDEPRVRQDRQPGPQRRPGLLKADGQLRAIIKGYHNI